MKLTEVLRPLLENKVDYLTENQWLKVFMAAYSSDVSIAIQIQISSDDITDRQNFPHSNVLFLGDLVITPGVSNYDNLKPEHIRKFDEEHPRNVFEIILYRGDLILSRNYTGPTLEKVIKIFVRDLLSFMTENISKKHLQWLVHRYIRHDFELVEDHQMIKRTLGIYDRVRKETNIPQLTKKVSYQDLFEELQPYIDAEEKEVRDAREQKLIANGELEIPFYANENEYVAIPKTFEASYHLSDPNGWCTSQEHWYRSYTKDDQTLYFFRHEGKAYLVHLESNQFMGRANKPFNVNEMASESEAFQWILKNIDLKGKKLSNLLRVLISLRRMNIELENIDEILLSASNVTQLYLYRGILLDWFKTGDVSESLIKRVLEYGMYKTNNVNNILEFLSITGDYEWVKDLVEQPSGNLSFEDNRFIIIAELYRKGHVSEEWFKEHYIRVDTNHDYYYMAAWKLAKEGKLSYEWLNDNFEEKAPDV